MNVVNFAALYIANLRAIYLIHQNNHWLASGDNFYGNHLLFEKIYKSAQDNADAAAERFIGLFGSECANYSLQVKLIHQIMTKYSKSENSPAEQSLAAEKDFIKISDEFYDFLDKQGKMSAGLDDLILSISSEREEAIYFLSRILL